MPKWPGRAFQTPKLNITGTTSCVKFASEPSKAQRLRSNSSLRPFSSARPTPRTAVHLRTGYADASDDAVRTVEADESHTAQWLAAACGGRAGVHVQYENAELRYSRLFTRKCRPPNYSCKGKAQLNLSTKAHPN